MRHILLAAFAVLVFSSSARAEVVDSSAGGFTVKTVLQISAPATNVYRAIVDRVGAWWESSHTFSGSASNLSIEATPGGCFCEQLPKGGGVRHMTVVYVDPGKLLRLNGGLGPLGEMAVAATMTLTLTEAAGKTTLEMMYKVGGYAPGGLDGLAKLVDGVLATQLQRMKRFVETDAPGDGPVLQQRMSLRAIDPEAAVPAPVIRSHHAIAFGTLVPVPAWHQRHLHEATFALAEHAGMYGGRGD